MPLDTPHLMKQMTSRIPVLILYTTDANAAHLLVESFARERNAKVISMTMGGLGSQQEEQQQVVQLLSEVASEVSRLIMKCI